MKRVALLLLVGLGAALLLAGLGRGPRPSSLERRGVRTTGTVVEILRTRSGDGEIGISISFLLKVEFEAGGKKRLVVGSAGSSVDRTPVGSTVSVIYDPADPSRAELGELPGR